MPATIPLSQPLQTHKGVVNELELRDLTAQDLAEVRVSPLSLTLITRGLGSERVTEQRIEVQYDLVMKYLARMSGVDAIILNSLPHKDVEKAARVITEIFNAAGE